MTWDCLALCDLTGYVEAHGAWERGLWWLVPIRAEFPSIRDYIANRQARFIRRHFSRKFDQVKLAREPVPSVATSGS